MQVFSQSEIPANRWRAANMVIALMAVLNANKTTLCVWITLRTRTAGGRTERERERKRRDEAAVKRTKQKGEKKRRNSGQCCGWHMLDRAVWVSSGLRQTLGEKGRLSNRWRKKTWTAWERSSRVSSSSAVIAFHNFSGRMAKLCRNHLLKADRTLCQTENIMTQLGECDLNNKESYLEKVGS